MARAGAVLVDTLALLQERIRPGVSTAQLDQLAERFIRSRGAVPTFKGYRGFPGSICASPNAMIVHGIPGPYRLAEGDIISIDVGVTLDGWVADAARTFAVGEISAAVANLLTATAPCLHAGVAPRWPGVRMGDLSSARLARRARRRGRGQLARSCAGRIVQGGPRPAASGPGYDAGIATIERPARMRPAGARGHVPGWVAAAHAAARARSQEASRRKGS